MARTVQLLRHDAYCPIKLSNQGWNQGSWEPIRFDNFVIVMINGIIAVLRFFLFMSNLAKQQIFSRNVSNVKQLIGSMGDMGPYARTSVFFFPFTSNTSTFTNKYDRLWPRKIYCILKGKRRQMPMFTSPKVATRHYSILNLCVSGWRFPCEFAHFNISAKDRLQRLHCSFMTHFMTHFTTQ